MSARHTFAPGVISVDQRAAPRWRRRALRALRWAWHVISVLCVAVVLLGLVGLARERVPAPLQACLRGEA